MIKILCNNALIIIGRVDILNRALKYYGSNGDNL